MNAPVQDTPDELRYPAAVQKLLSAARQFGDARMEVDRHEGDRAGPKFDEKVKAWHATNIALQSAARAYATVERNKE